MVASGDIVRAVLEALQEGGAVCLATVIRADEAFAVAPGVKMLVWPDGSALGSLGGALDEAVRGDCREALARHLVQTVRYSPDGRRLPPAAAEPGVEVLIEAIEPPATLLVVGGGHVGKALSQIGALLGFSVAIIDDRPEYASPARFPEADHIICGDFAEALRQFPIGPDTYVVIVTRDHRQDEESLRQVMGAPAAYVGMIGSRRRVGAVLQQLQEEGVPADAVARVHSPIGLDIGAETPEEIAVSIMAEIIQVRRQGSGRPLREGKQGRPRPRPADRGP
jgi:xanthine dehydrogenase accessory factor